MKELPESSLPVTETVKEESAARSEPATLKEKELSLWTVAV